MNTLGLRIQDLEVLLNLLHYSDGSNNVRSSMFEAKNRVFEFNYQKMDMFKFVQCSKE